MLDVITIGSATKDIFLISNAFKIKKSKQSPTGLMECIPFGSKIEIENAVYTTGGGGTNSAATFTNLGLKTGIITKIGDDSNGEDIINELKNYKIKTNLISKIKNQNTGLGVLLTATNGERSILINRGVSNHFTEQDIKWNKLKSEWIYLTSLGGNIKLAKKIIQHAKKYSIKIAFNPGGEELKHELKELKYIINNITILIINIEEAQKLVKIKTTDIKKLIQKISKKDLTLIVTDGPNGAYAHLNGTTWFAKPNNINSISRTGAGDAFGSGVVAGLIKNMGIDDALRTGMANAESVIQSYGAKIGILEKWLNESELKKYKILILK